VTSSPIIDKPIVLIGFMGSGKSTVGRLLAAKLQREFVDLDELLEQEQHATVTEIFVSNGEDGFRQKEAELLGRALAGGPRVLAAGGGAPCFFDNMDRMLANGTVVLLHTEIDQLLERIGSGAGRPLLARAADKRSEIERLLALRAPYYARAQLTVETSGRAPSQVVTAILSGLGTP
jgi:shikimate kinase